MELLLSKCFCSAREHPTRHCTDYGGFSDPTQAVACGIDAASHSCLQRIEVPVLQLALSGQTYRSNSFNDYGLNFIRTQLITVPGASVPYPMVVNNASAGDLNTTAVAVRRACLRLDVVNAISVQNLVLPTGTSKIGSRNTMFPFPTPHPDDCRPKPNPIKTMAALPSTSKMSLGTRWFPPQTNIVRVDGTALRIADLSKRRGMHQRLT